MNIFKIALCLVFAHYLEGVCSNTDLIEEKRSVNKKQISKNDVKQTLSDEQIHNLMNQSHPMKKRHVIKIDQKHDIITYKKDD